MNGFYLAKMKTRANFLLQCEFDLTPSCCVQDPSIRRLPLCCQRGGDCQHGDRAANEGEKNPNVLCLLCAIWHVLSSSWLQFVKCAVRRPAQIGFLLHLMCVHRGSVGTRTERATLASCSTSCFLLTPPLPRTGEKPRHGICQHATVSTGIPGKTMQCMRF